jgi:hypothetical protein
MAFQMWQDVEPCLPATAVTAAAAGVSGRINSHVGCEAQGARHIVAPTCGAQVAITLGRQDAPRSSFAHDVCVVSFPSIMYLRLIESFGGWMLDSAAEQESSGVSQEPQHSPVIPITSNAVDLVFKQISDGSDCR